MIRARIFYMRGDVMYTNTVTIFNCTGSENKGYVWYPTVLYNVDLMMDKGAIMQRMGTDKADAAKLHVKYGRSGNNIVVNGKVYLPPKEWNAQINELKATTLTFNGGVDFFMLGEYPESPVDDNDHIKGTQISGFFDSMNRKKDFVFRVSNVGGPYKLIPHFEIGGA